MEEYRITCRTRDSKERLISVGIGTQIFSVDQIWQWINDKQYAFYTFENNRRATVKHGISSTGRKYITTSPDGVSENNLDEIRECS